MAARNIQFGVELAAQALLSSSCAVSFDLWPRATSAHPRAIVLLSSSEVRSLMWLQTLAKDVAGRRQPGEGTRFGDRGLAAGGEEEVGGFGSGVGGSVENARWRTRGDERDRFGVVLGPQMNVRENVCAGRRRIRRNQIRARDTDWVRLWRATRRTRLGSAWRREERRAGRSTRFASVNSCCQCARCSMTSKARTRSNDASRNGRASHAARRNRTRGPPNSRRACITASAEISMPATDAALVSSRAP